MSYFKNKNNKKTFFLIITLLFFMILLFLINGKSNNENFEVFHHSQQGTNIAHQTSVEGKEKEIDEVVTNISNLQSQIQQTTSNQSQKATDLVNAYNNFDSPNKVTMTGSTDLEKANNLISAETTLNQDTNTNATSIVSNAENEGISLPGGTDLEKANNYQNERNQSISNLNSTSSNLMTSLNNITEADFGIGTDVQKANRYNTVKSNMITYKNNTNVIVNDSTIKSNLNAISTELLPTPESGTSSQNAVKLSPNTYSRDRANYISDNNSGVKLNYTNFNPTIANSSNVNNNSPLSKIRNDLSSIFNNATSEKNMLGGNGKYDDLGNYISYVTINRANPQQAQVKTPILVTKEFVSGDKVYGYRGLIPIVVRVNNVSLSSSFYHRNLRRNNYRNRYQLVLTYISNRFPGSTSNTNNTSNNSNFLYTNNNASLYHSPYDNSNNRSALITGSMINSTIFRSDDPYGGVSGSNNYKVKYSTIKAFYNSIDNNLFNVDSRGLMTSFSSAYINYGTNNHSARLTFDSNSLIQQNAYGYDSSSLITNTRSFRTSNNSNTNANFNTTNDLTKIQVGFLDINEVNLRIMNDINRRSLSIYALNRFNLPDGRTSYNNYGFANSKNILYNQGVTDFNNFESSSDYSKLTDFNNAQTLKLKFDSFSTNNITLLNTFNDNKNKLTSLQTFKSGTNLDSELSNLTNNLSNLQTDLSDAEQQKIDLNNQLINLNQQKDDSLRRYNSLIANQLNLLRSLRFTRNNRRQRFLLRRNINRLRRQRTRDIRRINRNIRNTTININRNIRNTNRINTNISRLNDSIANIKNNRLVTNNQQLFDNVKSISRSRNINNRSINNIQSLKPTFASNIPKSFRLAEDISSLDFGNTFDEEEINFNTLNNNNNTNLDSNQQNLNNQNFMNTRFNDDSIINQSIIGI